jgi:hypothetical protein
MSPHKGFAVFNFLLVVGTLWGYDVPKDQQSDRHPGRLVDSRKVLPYGFRLEIHAAVDVDQYYGIVRERL